MTWGLDSTVSSPTTAEDCPACAARGALTFDADTESAPAKGSPLLFEFHQGERVACPDCGRLYLRTLTNGDVPFMHRDVNEYSFQKLPERITPTPRPQPKPAPPTAAPEATELVRVLRCPRCRSTRVSRSTWEVSDEDDVRLTCEACHRVQTVNADDCTGWKVFLELPTGQRKLPEFVPLDVELPAVPVAAPAPVVEAPKPAPAVVVEKPVLAPPGCARCVGATAAAAWNAISGPSSHTFVREPHFSVHVSRCSCGQPFVVVFTERVDFRDGSDTQVELAVAVWPAEVEALAAGFQPLTLTKLVSGRAFLVKGTGDTPRWVASGFSIGPHD